MCGSSWVLLLGLSLCRWLSVGVLRIVELEVELDVVDMICLLCFRWIRVLRMDFVVLVKGCFYNVGVMRFLCLFCRFFFGWEC